VKQNLREMYIILQTSFIFNILSDTFVFLIIKKLQSEIKDKLKVNVDVVVGSEQWEKSQVSFTILHKCIEGRGGKFEKKIFRNEI